MSTAPPSERRASSRRAVCVAIVSDTHVGSTLAICPPEGVRQDDSGRYLPSHPQLWLWERWEAFWKEVARARKEHRADLWMILNGDATEGQHHGTTQVISQNPEAQAYVADRVFGVMKALAPERLFIIRGTEAHTGSSGSSEESLARGLGAERDPETQTWSRWRLRLNVNGKLFDAQHHGRIGTRPWTKQSTVSLLAFQIWTEHQLRNERPPDLAIRSHRHQFGDSFGAWPTRVIQTPSWQLKTSFAHKVATESIADIGGIITVVKRDGEMMVRPVLSVPSLPQVA